MTTLEHVGQFVIQCGEVSSSDIYKLRLFPLSLSGAAFTWFISLPSNSIYNWSDLEKKIHDYFFTDETELELSHHTSVKQNSNKMVSEYIRRFKYTRNQCYGLTISDRDLIDLAYAGLLDIHKAKLDGQEFLYVSQVFHKALANESRVKKSGNLQNLNEKVKRHVHLLNYESNYDILTQGFIGLIEYSYHQGIHSFLKARL
jgi:hypothetical protein